MEFATILAGVIGGAVVLLFEQVYLHVREKRKENRNLLVSFPNTQRIIDKTIFSNLSPGHTIELMRASLGTPDKTFIDTDPVFTQYREEEEGLTRYEFPTEEDEAKYEEHLHQTTAYFYDFKNAQVKITSKNKETIDSLSVVVKEGVLDVSELPLSWIGGDSENIEPFLLGEKKVDKDLIEFSRLEYEFSRYDNIIVLSVYTAAPLYTHYTYFGYPDFRDDVEIDKNNPESFVGGTITGVCLHDDEYNAYIIRAYDNM